MNRAAFVVLTSVLGGLAACAQAPGGATVAVPAATPETARAATKAAAVATTRADPQRASGTLATALPTVLVHKSASCGCCGAWVEHMRKAGFTVDVRNSDNLEPVKKRLGVPLGKGSCHTAELGRLVVEGHVPAEDIKRLLAANGGARGLVLPGMPAGSPGMEMPDGRVQRYTVEQVNADGSTSPFATHGG